MRPIPEKSAERGEPTPGGIEGWAIGDRIEFLPTTEQVMSNGETRGVISRIFGGKHATIHVDIPHGDRTITTLVAGNRADTLIRKLGPDE